jgi:hypothetical protein
MCFCFLRDGNHCGCFHVVEPIMLLFLKGGKSLCCQFQVLEPIRLLLQMNKELRGYDS